MARRGEEEDRRDGARGPIGGRRKDDPRALSEEDWQRHLDMQAKANMSKPNNIGFWNNKDETGHHSPVRIVITEAGVLLTEITAETPEEGVATLLQLLEWAHEQTGRNSPMALGIAAAAKILSDAVILEHELED